MFKKIVTLSVLCSAVAGVGFSSVQAADEIAVPTAAVEAVPSLPSASTAATSAAEAKIPSAVSAQKQVKKPSLIQRAKDKKKKQIEAAAPVSAQ